MTAPRYFWQQFDTYRIGITKQSESTMHTIMKNKLTQDNFENEIDGVILDILNDSISQKDFMKVKTNLPESFLQRRIISTDLKTLIYIYKQRKNHRLKEWKDFANFLQDFIFNNIQFQFLNK
jgi:flagellar biosynthesis protein FliP